VRVLVTNDDGIDSPGIAALAAVAVERGCAVVVAAPGWDSSGASASLTAVEQGSRLLFEARRLAGLDAPAFAVEASPAFIVRAAVHGAFGEPPELVISGINHGPNTGHAVLHSGTVGAALTATTFGRPSLAVSIGVGSPVHWATAAQVAGTALDWLIETGTPTTLNVNVPNVEAGELRGFEEVRLSAFGAVQTTVTEIGEGYVKLAYTDIDAALEPGTDAEALARQAACYTALRAVCEASSDVTAELAGRYQQVRTTAHDARPS
jgi:5'-nucleotidase